MKKLFCILAVVMLFACKKEKVEEPVVNQLSPYDIFLKTPAKKGGVLFAHTCQTISFIDDIWTARVLFDTYPSTTKTRLCVDGMTVKSDPHENYDIGGGKAVVEFEDGVTMVDFHIPQSLQLTAPKITYDWETNTIDNQTILKWKPDTENPHPLLIELEIATEFNYRELSHIHNSAYAENSGSYKLEDTLFKDIPDGAIVNLYALSYNFAFSPNNEYNLHAYSWTYFTATYRAN